MPTITVTLDRDKTVTLKYAKIPPMPTYALTIKCLADGREYSLAASIIGPDISESFITPKTFTLPAGTYKIYATNHFFIAGEEYFYSTYEVI